MKLGVSPTATSNCTGVFSQWFEALFSPHWNSGLGCLSPGSAAAASQASCSFAHPTPQSSTSLGPLALPCHKSYLPSCPSPPLLLIWMNVSSLSPWLLDFHSVQFSVSSGCFLFLNCCHSFGCQGGTVCLPAPPSWLEVQGFNS